MNSKMKSEIGTVLREAAVSFFEVDGTLSRIYTAESDHAMSVMTIDRLIDKIIRTNDKLFAIKTNTFSRHKYIATTALGTSLLNTLIADVPGIRACFNLHEFNPRFELFVQSARDRDLDYWLALRKGHPLEGPTKGYDALCGLVNAMREEGQRASFKAQLRHFNRSADKNYLSLYRYFRKVLGLHSRINFRRYDLCYQQGSPENRGMTQPCSMPIQQVKEHRETLIKSVRKGRIGECLVGYAWKMEYSALRGFQHHLVLLLDEDSLEEQTILDATMKEIWSAATENKGLLVDCSLLHPALKSIGIGLVENDNKDVWSIFRRICIQMTQTDNFIKLNLPGAVRTFGKGELSDKKVRK